LTAASVARRTGDRRSIRWFATRSGDGSTPWSCGASTVWNATLRHLIVFLEEMQARQIAERVRAGLARVRAAGGRLGRPVTRIAFADLERTAGLPVRKAAALLGVPRSVLHRARITRAACFISGVITER
jgi:hypothetical protein